MTPQDTLMQINRLVRHLVETGLADDQCFAFRREKGVVEITFDNAEKVSEALGNTSYVDVYGEFARDRVFNAKLLDGALIQMMYAFVGNKLQKHRLAFFPAPHLEQFGRDPDAYLEDQLYADIVGRNVLPLPIRFDYDARVDRHRDVAHSKSHLTLGEYSECRIPVSAPLTPHRFIDFILRSFYRTRSHDRFLAELPHLKGSFVDSITKTEREVLHVVVPSRGSAYRAEQLREF